MLELGRVGQAGRDAGLEIVFRRDGRQHDDRQPADQGGQRVERLADGQRRVLVRDVDADVETERLFLGAERDLQAAGGRRPCRCIPGRGPGPSP